VAYLTHQLEAERSKTAKKGLIGGTRADTQHHPHPHPPPASAPAPNASFPSPQSGARVRCPSAPPRHTGAAPHSRRGATRGVGGGGGAGHTAVRRTPRAAAEREDWRVKLGRARPGGGETCGVAERLRELEHKYQRERERNALLSKKLGESLELVHGRLRETRQHIPKPQPHGQPTPTPPPAPPAPPPDTGDDEQTQQQQQQPAAGQTTGHYVPAVDVGGYVGPEVSECGRGGRIGEGVPYPPSMESPSRLMMQGVPASGLSYATAILPDEELSAAPTPTPPPSNTDLTKPPPTKRKTTKPAAAGGQSGRQARDLPRADPSPVCALPMRPTAHPHSHSHQSKRASRGRGQSEPKRAPFATVMGARVRSSGFSRPPSPVPTGGRGGGPRKRP